MNKKRINEISSYMAGSIIQQIWEQEQIHYRIREAIHADSNMIVCQWYFDPELNMVFFYYNLDGAIIKETDRFILQNRINSILRNNFFDETDISITIIGPGTKYSTSDSMEWNTHHYYNDDFKDDPSIHGIHTTIPKSVRNGYKVNNMSDLSNKTLRTSTYSYWKVNSINGQFYEFLEHSFLFERDSKAQLSNADIVEFVKKVVNLNNKYDLEKEPDKLPELFDLYSDLYYETFGRRLKKIEDKDINYIYLEFIGSDHDIKEYIDTTNIEGTMDEVYNADTDIEPDIR